MRPADSAQSTAEHILHGVRAAPGTAWGRAAVLQQHVRPDARPIAVGRREHELGRARAALEAAATDLERLAADLRAHDRSAEADIVETGALMAEDPSLAAAITALVMSSGRGASTAVVETCEEFASRLEQLPDPTLALRAEDVRSLGRRAVAHLEGRSGRATEGILIAESLGPADIAELGAGVLGAALARGGVTAHAAIVARSLGLPMVVGLGPEVLEVRDGEELVLDGDRGLVVRRPAGDRVDAVRAAAEARAGARALAVARRAQPATTRDGRGVTVLANAASVAEAREAVEQGAEGVGLLRTELLFLDAAAWPVMAQHSRFLEPILAALEGRPATVRLLDFGGDKTPPFLRGTHDRGVELLLRAPQALADQLAAIAAIGAHRVRILIPMVSSVEQVRAVRTALSRVAAGASSPPVGAMIETREAVANAQAIARECDFFSIGTNDLTQQLLNIDRERAIAAPVTDPRVLASIDTAMRAARAAGIPVDVCGEAASDHDTMPLMVGLGADELSVAAARVGEVRELVRGLDFGECARTVGALLG